MQFKNKTNVNIEDPRLLRMFELQVRECLKKLIQKNWILFIDISLEVGIYWFNMHDMRDNRPVILLILSLDKDCSDRSSYYINV